MFVIYSNLQPSVALLDLLEYIVFLTRPNLFFPRQVYDIYVSIIGFVFHLNMVTLL